MKLESFVVLLALAGVGAGCVKAPRGPETAIRLADACVVRAMPPKGRDADKMAETVAALTNVLCRKTGVSPRVLERAPADAKAVIYVGDAAVKASGETLADMRRGDWRVKSEPGKVFLLGKTATAVECAMVEFCERYCDYYFLLPGGDDPCARDASAVVPVADVTVRPAIYCRSLYTAMINGNAYPKTKANWARWNALRRLNIPYDVEGRYRVSFATPQQCHTQFYYCHPDKYFKTHPEYFSMDEHGKRSAIFNYNSQLCYTSEGALEACYESLLAYIAKDRAKFPKDYPCVYDFTQLDNSSFLCKCPKCRAVIAKYNRVPGGHAEGGDAGLQLEFANKLARRVREVYPDVQIRVFAYVSTECPPKEGTIRPEPNVVIWWCDVYSHSDHTLPLASGEPFNLAQAGEIDGWLKLTKNIHLWDYMLYTHAYPEVAPDAIAADAKFFAERGLSMISMESEYRNQPFYLLNSFLMSELYIDPTRDVDGLIATFCRVYGPAKDDMYRAIRALRKMESDGHAKTAADWHNRLLPWLTRANLEKLAAMFRAARERSGLTPAQIGLVSDALASTWHELVTLLKADPLAAEAYAHAQREWLRCEKEVSEYAFMEPTDRAKYWAKAQEEHELLTLSFKDLPPELAAAPAKDLVCVDYHAGSPRVEDKTSSRGWAVATKVGDRYYSGKLPMACGVYDFPSKTSDTYKIESLPADGAYAWVKLGPAYIGRRASFWFPGSWQSGFQLTGYHILADGLPEDPNHYVVWASARLAGNRVYVDRLVFRRTADPKASKGK